MKLKELESVLIQLDQNSEKSYKSRLLLLDEAYRLAHKKDEPKLEINKQ